MNNITGYFNNFNNQFRRKKQGAKTQKIPTCSVAQLRYAYREVFLILHKKKGKIASFV